MASELSLADVTPLSSGLGWLSLWTFLPSLFTSAQTEEILCHVVKIEG